MESRFRGCLLGMAVGDAMGAAVEKKSYEEICETYGPAGLLGYDTVNGLAEITSYTQVAAYALNGLLLGISRGQTHDAMAYITMALKEWASVQHFPKDPHRRNCWLRGIPAFRRRKCMDPRTLDALTRDVLGTPKKPSNQADGPGSLTVAVAVGMYFHPERTQFHKIGVLGAQTVALTHGDPEAFLSAAVLAYTVAGIIQEPEYPLEDQFSHAIEAVKAQFGGQYPQAELLAEQLHRAIAMANAAGTEPHDDMEKLYCGTAGECLAGAIYACLTSHEDFDTAMITAVNHSGKSAAVAAIAGAVLGALLTEEGLPDFYLESLEASEVLGQLAEDFAQGSPTRGLFDTDWDHKYNQGLPL